MNPDESLAYRYRNGGDPIISRRRLRAIPVVSEEAEGQGSGRKKCRPHVGWRLLGSGLGRPVAGLRVLVRVSLCGRIAPSIRGSWQGSLVRLVSVERSRGRGRRMA